MKKGKTILLCITIFLIGLFLNPLEYYQTIKSKKAVNTLLLDNVVLSDLFEVSSKDNYEVIQVNKDTFKIVIDNDNSFVILAKNKNSYFEIFKLVNNVNVN